MPCLTHHGIKLHYTIAGQGTPLLLLAGTSLALRRAP